MEISLTGRNKKKGRVIADEPVADPALFHTFEVYGISAFAAQL